MKYGRISEALSLHCRICPLPDRVTAVLGEMTRFHNESGLLFGHRATRPPSGPSIMTSPQHQDRYLRSPTSPHAPAGGSRWISI
jgi:hypothetical protein